MKSSKKIKIRIKKKKKTDYYDSNGYLTYEPTPFDEDVIQYIENKRKINFELISKLPNIKIGNQTNSKNMSYEDNIDLVDNDDECDTNELSNKDCDTVEIPDDIDIDNLLKDIVGGNCVYYDYNKNLIYNDSYVIIGTINEEGEIYLDDNYKSKYKSLVS